MSKEFDINVKHLSEKNYAVRVSDDTTVAELKQKLTEQTSAPTDQMKLIFKGKILKADDDKMSDLKVTEGSALHLIINKPQGESQANSQPTNNTQTNTQAPTNPTANANPFNTTGNAQPGFNNANPFGGMGGSGGFGGFDMNSMGGMGGMGGLGGMNPQMAQQMMQNPQFRAMAQNLLANPEALRNMISSNPMLSQMAQNNPQLQAMLDNPQMMAGMQNMFGGPTPTGDNANPNAQTGQQPQGFPDLSAFMNNPQMAQGLGGMGGFNPGMFGQQQPQQSNLPPEEEYKEQLERLAEMGFTNKDLNITVLKQCYGNVDAAIDRLLGMFQ